eukprot:COSAG06_NODE_3238_length_5631_cov_20.701193_5_plen_73_part_00
MAGAAAVALLLSASLLAPPPAQALQNGAAAVPPMGAGRRTLCPHSWAVFLSCRADLTRRWAGRWALGAGRWR